MKLPPITNKQLEILVLLYRFRFLNTYQITSLLNHKSSGRIKEWLLDLTTKGLVCRTYSRSFGENTKPAVYFLAPTSVHFLKKQKDVNTSLLKRIYKEKTRSVAFRERCIFIASIYLNLEASSKENSSTFHFFTKTELEAITYLPNPLPDAYIALEEKDKIRRYFLEIISDQVPRFAIRNNINNLFEYYDENTWQEATNHPFPSVLMICPNHVLKAFFSKFITEILESEGSDINFFLTTKNQIEATGMNPKIWEKVE